MGYGERKFFTDPNRLAEGFLIEEFIYDPDVPEEKELSAEHRAQADWALRHWRGEFYRYNRRRYVKVSDSEMRLLITRHLKME